MPGARRQRAAHRRLGSVRRGVAFVLADADPKRLTDRVADYWLRRTAHVTRCSHLATALDSGTCERVPAGECEVPGRWDAGQHRARPAPGGPARSGRPARRRRNTIPATAPKAR